METDFAPMGETRLRQVLDAVVAEGDAAEYLGLEAKSDIDLSKKGVGVAKIAKFILGMANRMPEVAADHFKGYGVMVIGAGKGQSPGLPKGVEAHELADRLKPYLGPDGPRWDLARLSTSDTHEVLFVLVEPPAAGQPLFLCHKDYQPADKADAKFSLADGDIYVRDKSRTRKANASDVRALLSRGAPALPEVAIDFGVHGRALFVVDTDSSLRRIIADESDKTRKEAEKKKQEAEESSRKEAEAARRKWASSPKDGDPTAFLPPAAFDAMRQALAPLANPRIPGVLFGTHDPPPPRDLEKVIREKEARRWNRWPECRENLYAVTAERIRFTVENQAASYLSEPQIIVTIHEARAIEPQDADDLKDHEVLPFVDKPGRPAGPYGIALPEFDYPTFRPSFPNPEIDWSNEDDNTVKVVLSPSALRPSTPWTSDDDELILIALNPAASELTGTWSLTAEGIGKRFDGKFTIPVQKVEDAVDLMRTYVNGTRRR